MSKLGYVVELVDDFRAFLHVLIELQASNVERLLYSAKFSRRLIYTVFADSFPTAKIKLRKTSIPCLVWFPDHSARSLV